MGHMPATVGEAAEILRQHGLDGSYCPHCDHFQQAGELARLDELIADLLAACKAAHDLLRHHHGGKEAAVYTQLREAIAKAKSPTKLTTTKADTRTLPTPPQAPVTDEVVDFSQECETVRAKIKRTP